MSKQPLRNAEGGRIDRSRIIAFRFDGRTLYGYAGDTLASALLANGVRVVGRSFKYHRPRGIFAAGAEEPSALVRVGSGARVTPNLRATQVELYDGRVASSQHCWPSLQFDVGVIAGYLSPLLPAGFYYKTFMWPASAWMTYERIIRRAAGLGRAPTDADPDRYEHRHAFCDVLIAGAGPTGLATALAAGRAGARVILADECAEAGGGLLGARAVIGGAPATDWVTAAVSELDSLPNVRMLARATVFGYYDHNLLAIAERRADHLGSPAQPRARERLWMVRARRVVLATGAIERSMVFANNDLPGVMLASAARRYANQYAVRPGAAAVVLTNNDSAYAAAQDLQRAGTEVKAIVDVRADAGARGGVSKAREIGVEVLSGHGVVLCSGAKRLRRVEVMALDTAGERCLGEPRRIDCDLLCVSGGWNPAVHLFSQSQGRLRFDDVLAAFVPGESRQAERSAGACRGSFQLQQCLEDGFSAGAEAAALCGHGDGRAPVAPACEQGSDFGVMALWRVPQPEGRHAKQFVDLQNDVTADDVGLAVREGYRNVEHLKRYTTLGMGTDQGRTSNVTGLAILADITGRDIPAVGTTTFRPPYTPVTLGTLVGAERGAHLAPLRRSPMHAWHEQAGAPFVPAGLWRRASCYPNKGETIIEATQREVRAVRENVGIVDVSTLGKIDIQGNDAAEFLERIYINRWKTLRLGRIRYGAMLREDGMVFDDGTCTRVAENRFFMTTTTAHAAQVLLHLERYAQTVWPDMDVHLTSTTDHWAAMAVAGPNSRAVLSEVIEGLDLSNEAFPHLSYGMGRVAQAPVRLFRMTYSGELAYEVHTPAGFGLFVWQRILEVGKSQNIVPYGTEAMNVLRIEKGHIVIGAEIDGRTTAHDLGLSPLLKKEPWFVGQRLLERPALQEPGRKKLVGLRAADDSARIPTGAQLVYTPYTSAPVRMFGHVTSSTFSPSLGRPIALALLAGGLEQKGNILYAASPLTGEHVAVRVTEPVFVDSKGMRPRA